MLFPNGRQRAAQVHRRIALCSTRRNRVAKNLSADLMNAMGGFKRAARFNSAKHCQQIRSRDLTGWACPQPRENVALQPLNYCRRMSRCPSCGKLLEPFPRDGLEASAFALHQSGLGRLALRAGIDTV